MSQTSNPPYKMGRTEPTVSLAPQAHRKDVRAKQARSIINKTIPALLASNARARRGVEEASLIVDPPALGSRDAQQAEGAAERHDGRKGKGKGKAKPKEEVSEQPSTPLPERQDIRIRIRVTDTLTAAYLLSHPAQDTAGAEKSAHRKSSSASAPNPVVLNMASPLRPGGGVLNGATSQEEFLCARTTLYPSLREPFYRLPEIGGVFTKDVLVFRDAGSLEEPELGVKERWWVDVITAGALRFPDVEEGEGGAMRFSSARDREIMERKMRAVMRIVCAKGARKIVLGAWGCGAYGNPVAEVARGWKKVILGPEEGKGGGNRRKKGRGNAQGEVWDGVEDVVFAILNRKMAEEFARCFGGGVVVEDELSKEEDGGSESQEDTEVIEELNSKIKEMEAQITQVWNPDLKARLETVLLGLRRELADRRGIADEGSAEEVSANTNEEDKANDEDDENDFHAMSDDGSEEAAGGVAVSKVHWQSKRTSA